MFTKEYIENLLKSYHQRERDIAVRRFELANFTKLTGDEYISAASHAKGDGAGHVPGHISNKTLHIALNYREQTDRLNQEAVMEINRELEELESEQRRLEYYVSLLDERQAKTIEMAYFQRLPLEKIAKSLGLAERTVQDIRREAIESLVRLYQSVLGRLSHILEHANQKEETDMRDGKITMQEYQKLMETDIRAVDPSTVPDIREVRVDTNLPVAERLMDVSRQMNGNPFVYRCGDILVKTSFAGTASLQSVLEDCLEKA